VTADGERRVVRDPVTCCFCREPADLARGAVIRLPGDSRWGHRVCWDAHPEVAAVAERHMARALRFRHQRRVSPEVR
jgi:hypothetical protein